MSLTKAFPRMMEGVAISVKDFGAVGDGVTDDNLAIENAVSHCKETGANLYFPAGTYNANVEVSWAVQQSTVDSISSNPLYDPSSPDQYTSIGLHFNIEMDAEAVIDGDFVIDRCKFMQIFGGTVTGNFIMTSSQILEVSNVDCKGVGSLAYASDSDPTAAIYPKRYSLTFAFKNDGSCYWIKFNKCAFRGFVIGGADAATHNVIQFNNCLMTGATAASVSGLPAYLNHKGAGLYVDMIAGHTDGITLTNCDLSYGDYPLWNNESRPINMIGCYYEDCTNNFFTKNGTDPSPTAANVFGGFDYDYAVNQRIGLRATRWALQGNLGGADNYAKFQIPAFGGAIDFEDTTFGSVGLIQSRTDNSSFGNTVGIAFDTVENSVAQQTTAFGYRPYKNWNTIGTFKKISALAAGNSTTVRILPVNPPASGNIAGNARLKVVVVGSVNNNSAGAPILWEGYISLASGGTWSAVTGVSGSLVGSRVTASFSNSGNELICTITNTQASGTFTGTVNFEATIDSITSDDDGKYIYWRTQNS